MVFVDALRFLPSIPATAVTPFHNIGYNNSLVEMAQQSRMLVRNLAKEHLHLVHQIECLGLTQELGLDAIDAVLKAVANGEEASIPMPQIPMARHAAAAAGALGQSATDVSAPTAHQLTPSVVAAAVEGPPNFFQLAVKRDQRYRYPLTAFT